MRHTGNVPDAIMSANDSALFEEVSQHRWTVSLNASGPSGDDFRPNLWPFRQRQRIRDVHNTQLESRGNLLFGKRQWAIESG